MILTKSDILYEDNHLLIVNKKSGWLVQSDSTGDQPLVEMVREYLRSTYEKKGNVFVGLVHRLDRPVSGLILFSKTTKGLKRMSEYFKNKTIQKTYWAVVKTPPPEEEARLEHWLVKDTEKNTVTAHTLEVEGGYFSVLSYKVIKQLNGYYLLEVKPITGRPHQIRVQLAFIGCPIRGDIKYNYPNQARDKSIALHAKRLEFIHPVKKTEICVESPLPDTDFWRQFKE